MNTLATATREELPTASRTQYQRSVERLGRTVDLMTVDGVPVCISGRLLKTGKVRDEPYVCLDAAEQFVAKLRQEQNRPDLLSFMQRIGDQQARYPFYYERESLAVLQITTFKDWWKNKIRTHTRNHIKKAEKKGVELRLVPFDDNLVRGVKGIYDECPLRQGRPFWHYRKDYETIKAGLATFLDRSDFIGAFWEDELIGFIKMTSQDGTAGLMHIISMISHRDKAPTDALMMKAVELCAQKKISYLHYGLWSAGGFGKFKENHSFERHDVPRYFVPLTVKGELALKLGLHRRPVDRLAPVLRERLVALRNNWNAFRFKPRGDDGSRR